eukprot:COSAG06_NODE_11660_length_1480_cov_1.032585_3_plen_124_part_00
MSLWLRLVQTEEQLRQMMDAADAEYLLSKLEPNEDGGYDYKSFVNVAYGKQEAPADHYTKAVGRLTPRPAGTQRTRGSTMSSAPAPAPTPAPEVRESATLTYSTYESRFLLMMHHSLRTLVIR